jgi:hypothetical protein
MNFPNWKTFILGLVFLIGGFVHAQPRPIEVACPVGQSPLSTLVTSNPNTGGLHNNGCVDNNGNLSLAPAIVPGKLGPQTYNVVSAPYNASSTARRLIGSYSSTNPGTTGPHTITALSGNGFLITDVGTQLDCYNAGGPFQTINSQIVTSFVSASVITTNGTNTGSGGGGGTDCVIGGLDATAAIIAARDALIASGKPGLFYFPCGGYFVTSPISSTLIPNGSFIQGDASSCVTFFLPGDFAWSTTVVQLFNTTGQGNTFLQSMSFDALGQTVTTAIQAVFAMGGPGYDLNALGLVATSAVSACITGTFDNASNLTFMRAINAKCGGQSAAVSLFSHGGSLINPQISGNFVTSEADMSLMGGYVNGTITILGFGASLNSLLISEMRIFNLTLATNAGVFLSNANIGPCFNGRTCVGTENATGISIDSTSVLNISNSNVSGGGAGNFAISNAGKLINGGGNNVFVTNGATAYGGAGTFQSSSQEAGTVTCAASAATITFKGIYSIAPNYVIQDRTTAGAVTQTSENTTTLVLGCPGATDILNYTISPNPV